MWFNVGYLHNFPNLATIKWLASTYQPNLKWVMGLNTQLSRQFQPKSMAGAGPITNFMVGWKVQVSHFIVAALGNHTSSHTLFQNGPLRCQGLHLEALEAKSRNTKGWQMLAQSPISWWVGGLRTSSSHYSKIAHWKARVGTGRHWKQNEGMAKSKWRMAKWFDSKWGAEICWLAPWPFVKGTSHFIEIL